MGIHLSGEKGTWGGLILVVFRRGRLILKGTKGRGKTREKTGGGRGKALFEPLLSKKEREPEEARKKYEHHLQKERGYLGNERREEIVRRETHGTI